MEDHAPSHLREIWENKKITKPLAPYEWCAFIATILLLSALPFASKLPLGKTWVAAQKTYWVVRAHPEKTTIERLKKAQQQGIRVHITSMDDIPDLPNQKVEPTVFLTEGMLIDGMRWVPATQIRWE